jgi:hypothetical protein
MIVEDHDMSDCLATYGYKLRLDRQASLLSSRCGIRQPVGSNHHHSFLKRLKIEISENLKFLARISALQLLLAVNVLPAGLDLSWPIETEQ